MENKDKKKDPRAVLQIALPQTKEAVMKQNGMLVSSEQQQNFPSEKDPATIGIFNHFMLINFKGLNEIIGSMINQIELNRKEIESLKIKLSKYEDKKH